MNDPEYEGPRPGMTEPVEPDDDRDDDSQYEQDADDVLRDEDLGTLTVDSAALKAAKGGYAAELPPEHLERHRPRNGNKRKPGKTWQGDDREGVYRKPSRYTMDTAKADAEISGDGDQASYIAYAPKGSRSRMLECQQCGTPFELDRPWPCEFADKGEWSGCQCNGCEAVDWPRGNTRRFCEDNSNCSKRWHRARKKKWKTPEPPPEGLRPLPPPKTQTTPPQPGHQGYNMHPPWSGPEFEHWTIHEDWWDDEDDLV